MLSTRTHNANSFRYLKADESAFTLIEILAALLISTVIALGIVYSSLASQRLINETRHNGMAAELAIEKLEELATIDPQYLSDDNDETELEVAHSGLSFSRTTDITINDDHSRTAEVTVTSNAPSITASVTVSNTYSLWGER